MAKRGRPTKYKAEYARQAFRLCLLGATDKDLATFFDTTERQINRWKLTKPQFCQSLKTGKERADAAIAKSLYHRGLGYSHKDVHISSYEGKITITPIIKHYPPDTTACIFWLKNRRPDLWRDRHDLTTDGQKIEPAAVCPVLSAKVCEDMGVGKDEICPQVD